ncbi:SxtJ family membrane protein [Deltaproteobacteria bacterium TL4]
MKVESLDKAGYRKFGFTMALVIAVLFGLFLPLAFNLKMVRWPWILSSLLLGWAVVLPNTMALIYKPWMRLSHYLGILNTRLLLVFVFFAVFFPVALLLKLSRKDAMNRQFKDGSIDSYWKKSQKQFKNHMEKVY